MSYDAVEGLRNRVLVLLESLSEPDRDALARIEAALERIESGTYGQCISCQGAIELARLEASPETDECAGCAARSPTATPNKRRIQR